MRIALIPNIQKPAAVAAADELQALLQPRADTVVLHDPALQALRAAAPDLVVILGGDGSILHVAGRMAGLDASPPVVGINFGKLGYLAAYSIEEFRQHLDLILSGQAPETRRLLLEGSILDNGTAELAEPTGVLLTQPPRFRYTALNDIVINAGEPFKMIELHVRIDEDETTTFRGDGVVVSTASGSTGYNLSAGGPLLTPSVNAMVLTPICPHSLSFRPVVLPDTSVILIHPHRTNPGTGVSFDGQITQPLSISQCLMIRRAPRPLRLVENPSMSHWRMLASKLHWARSPRQ